MLASQQQPPGALELLVTEDAFATAGVDDLIHESGCQATSTSVRLRGIEEPLTVYQVCAQ